MPASSASSAKSKAERGDASAGLRTTEQPTASAGATFQTAIVSGKFQGTIAATTPAGSRWIRASELRAVFGISSRTLSMASPNQRKVRITARLSTA